MQKKSQSTGFLLILFFGVSRLYSSKVIFPVATKILSTLKKVALIFVLLVGVISFADDYEHALEALKNHEYNKAAKLCTIACNHKNAEACLQLGWLYDNGLGIERNPFKSVELYTKGCNYGNGSSCNLIGQMYYQGRIVGNDDMKALSLFKKGCALNDSVSCISVANVEDKHGIYNRKDLAKAYSSFGLNKNNDENIKNKINLCNNGNMKECQTVGTSYIDGSAGSPKDVNKGLLFLSKACDSNEPMINATNCMLVSVVYLKFQKDTKKAQLYMNKSIQKFTSACETGNAKACLTVAATYKENRILANVEFIKQDISKSNKFYEKACNLGEQEGCKKIHQDANRNNIEDEHPGGAYMFVKKHQNNTTDEKTVEVKKAVDESECDSLGGKWQWDEAAQNMQCV